MIPLRDENPTRSLSFVTLLLIAANLGVFLYELSAHEVVEKYALVPVEFMAQNNVTVVTSMFLHASWLHLLGNMLYLWIFGNNVEDSIGHGGFVVFYLLCGVAAAATQIAFDPRSDLPMVGASGAVSGILGAYLLLFPRARVLTLVPIWIFLKLVRVPAWAVLLIWFGLQLLYGLVGMSSGVAIWAHIGGFVAGLILIPVFKKRSARLFR